MNDLTWIQDWYASKCNGDWEHQHGIQIGTIDNPGWQVRISLQGVELLLPNFASEREGETDWFVCRIRDGFFEAFGGSKNLDDILAAFRECVEPITTDDK